MWIFTDIADAFDQTRRDNDRWVDRGLQEWVGSTLYNDSPWYRNVAVYTSAGTLYALNKFTGFVAAGFVDVLRIGDGVKEGSTGGVVQDGLRAMVIAGPALRLGRRGLALAQSVDVGAGMLGNCSWVSAARALRLTGHRPWAQVRHLAAKMGLTAETTGPAFLHELLPALKALKVPSKMIDVPRSQMWQMEQAVAKAVAQNPRGSTLLSIEYAGEAHTVAVFRTALGRLRYIDRNGKVYRTLAALSHAYPKLGTGTLFPRVMHIPQARWVSAAEGLHVPSLIASALAPDALTPRLPPQEQAFEAALAGLSAMAQSLFEWLEPGAETPWAQVKGSFGASAELYRAAQELERKGLVVITRQGGGGQGAGDNLNYLSLRRYK